MDLSLIQAYYGHSTVDKRWGGVEVASGYKSSWIEKNPSIFPLVTFIATVQVTNSHRNDSYCHLGP